jgi:hypothetical protein
MAVIDVHLPTIFTTVPTIADSTATALRIKFAMKIIRR